MKNKILSIILVCFFLISFVNAFDRFQQHQNATIELPTYENDFSKCITCSCEISVNNPDGVLFIDSQAMDINTNRISYNLSGSDLDKLGNYFYDIYCTNAVDYGGGDGYFSVTTTKRELSSGESIIYFLMLAFIFSLFSLSLYFSFAIPFINQANMQFGYIEVTRKKYLKLIFIMITYGLFIWLINFLIGLSDNFIGLNNFYNFLTFLFNLLVGMIIPLLILMILLFVYELVKDFNIKKQMRQWGRIMQ